MAHTIKALILLWGLGALGIFVMSKGHNKGHKVMPRILIWDNDGTILGSQNPHDTTLQAKVILPNVEKIMRLPGIINIICSGCKTPESEMQNFDHLKVVSRFQELMRKLPITATTFSPSIGGIHCYLIIQDKDGRHLLQAKHEEARYQSLIGNFKKPGSGMLQVIKDFLQEQRLDSSASLMMIGDTWHDQEAAHQIGIPFIHAHTIHSLPACTSEEECLQLLDESAKISG